MARKKTEKIDIALIKNDKMLTQLVLKKLAIRNYNMR